MRFTRSFSGLFFNINSKNSTRLYNYLFDFVLKFPRNFNNYSIYIINNKKRYKKNQYNSIFSSFKQLN